MHVLLTNDDGPPCDDHSPYIRQLIQAIQESTDWVLTVVLPDSQKSWIGRAHLINKNSRVRLLSNDESSSKKPWFFVSGTPATCVNIGLHHLSEPWGPVDLVISGPNYGRNSSALYLTSSGTVGASMEAALCGVKSIALSYSYDSRTHNQDHIKTAAGVCVRLIQRLVDTWHSNVEIYSVNLPLNQHLSLASPIVYAPVYPNRWKSAYKRVSDFEFEWSPDFAGVDADVKANGQGHDAYLLSENKITISPLRANIQQTPISEEFVI